MEKTASLNIVCRTNQWNTISKMILSVCQRYRINVLSVDASEYWKDLRCTQAFLALSSNTDSEKWHEFFFIVFGKENNLLIGNSLTHCDSPILDEAAVFGDLCIQE